MKITEHFKMSELCHTDTGLDNTPPNHIQQFIRATARILENVRSIFGRPIYVNSCYRSPLVNRAVGGSPSSHHLKGTAVDIRVYHLDERSRMSLENALRLYKPIEFIKYDTFWHVAFDIFHLGHGNKPVSTYQQVYPELEEAPYTSGDL
ncbi:MAG: hypothetical protein J6Q07_01250 [Alistipes sp.]|nr:hypothetical protein [Alistipes sp.]